MSTTEDHRFDVLDMPRFLEALHQDIERAQRRVDVETYILRDDRLGREFGALLMRAAGRGVRTRVLYDPHGSNEADPRFFDFLRQHGVDTRPYSRMGARLGRLSPAIRNHSRMLILDDVAYTGGHAWADEWRPRSQGGQGWHDLSCRAQGPVVAAFEQLFDQRWAEAQGGEPLDFDTGQRYPDVRLVSDGPHGEPLVLNALLDAFGSARKRIWIENAYFFPSPRLVESLGAAARRGVDVRLVLPAESDLRLVARAAKAEYSDWLRRRIEIWEYLPSVLHAKSAIVDDDWATVGTFNANPSSARLSIELTLIVRQRAFVVAMERQFESDMRQSRLVTEADLARRGFSERLVDELAYAVMSVTYSMLGP